MFVVASLLCCLGTLTWAQKECDVASLGLKPLTDVVGSTWNGVVGGLYPDASNERPFDQHLAFQEHALDVRAVRTDGTVDKVNGNIVVLGIGSSDAKVVFDCLNEYSSKDTLRNRTLRFANACRKGLGVQNIMTPASEYWNDVQKELTDSGYSSTQVQIAWVMIEDTDNADTAFPQAAKGLANKLYMLCATIKLKFPSIKFIYFSSRPYSGFVSPDVVAQSRGLAFPRDYINGWGVKVLVERQIEHKIGYSYTDVNAVIPAVTWSAYLWADGSTPNADGLSWLCDDYESDGITLSLEGAKKAGNLVHRSFIDDQSASGWYTDKTAVSVDDKAVSTLPIRTIVADGSITITAPNSDVMIMNIQGKVMWLCTSSDATSRIDTSSWPAGVYVIRIGAHTEIISINS